MYRKFKADNIFTGTDLTGPGKVLIVSADGTVDNIVPEEEAGENIEIFEGILSPGFINAHCHIELSHLKNSIPKHTGLVDFVQLVMKVRAAIAEEKEAAMKTAEEELFAGGTVAIGDICNTRDSIPLKLQSSLHWHNFIEMSGFVAAGAQKRFDDGLDILKAFKEAGLHHAALSPHAPYSVSKELFKLINDATAQQIISIHSSEAAAENELYSNRSGNFLELYKNFGIDISSFEPTGKSSFQSWFPHFDKGQTIISVHNTFLTEQDLPNTPAETNDPQIYFCLCPNANLYIENTLPPVDMLLKNNVNIVIGTDSYASNKQLSIIAEINTIQKHFPHIKSETVLQWATLNGARALGISNIYGSFEKGKRPGIVLIKRDNAVRLL